MLTVDTETFARLRRLLCAANIEQRGVDDHGWLAREVLSLLGLQAPELPITKGGDAMQSAHADCDPRDCMLAVPECLRDSAGGRVGTDSPPYETAPRLTKGVSDEHDWMRGLDGAYHSTEARCVLCGLEANEPLPVRGCPRRVVRVESEK